MRSEMMWSIYEIIYEIWIISWSADFFQASSFQLLKSENLLRWSSSLSLKTVSDHISKHLKVHGKHSWPVHVLFSTLLVFNVVKPSLSCLIYYLRVNLRVINSFWKSVQKLWTNSKGTPVFPFKIFLTISCLSSRGNNSTESWI